MISSMLSASKPPKKHTHYENKILVWGPITELTNRIVLPPKSDVRRKSEGKALRKTCSSLHEFVQEERRTGSR